MCLTRHASRGDVMDVHPTNLQNMWYATSNLLFSIRIPVVSVNHQATLMV
jgi:hypothetical protein